MVFGVQKMFCANLLDIINDTLSGNILTFTVIHQMKIKSCFYNLLLALTVTVFDLIFIVSGGINYFSRVHGKSQTFILLFPYFLYPLR